MKKTGKTLSALAVALVGGVFCVCSLESCSHSVDTTTTSPDGKIALTFGVENGRPYYFVKEGTTTVVDTSFVGIDALQASFGKQSKIAGVHHTSLDTTWEQPWGEERLTRNHYNEMTVSLEERGDNKVLKYDVIFRVFDDGVGFRYMIPEQAGLDSLTIMEENTEFNIPGDPTTWAIDWDNAFYEELYIPKPLSEIDTVSTPMTMKMSDSLYVAIHEAALTDYASQNLHRTGDTNRLHSYLTPWSTGEKVFAKLPLSTPWRTIIIARNPGDLMLSRIMLNLNEPCAIEDVSWIEPGRYIGIWWGMHTRDYTWKQGPKHGATTENMKRYIDFAAANGYSGVLVEGWNKGWEGYDRGVGNEFSFTEAYPDFDIEEVTEYGRGKGVRMIGHHETCGDTKHYESQMDSAFALCERLGINAVKTGYVGKLLDGKERHGSQYAVRHYRNVIETAARHHVMIDNHEPVMPTGLQRTYPNLMTQEGVRGQEWDAWSADGGNPPEHTATLPFTRGLAGPMDFTPGTFDFTNKVMPQTHVQTTLAKQLALSVVIYSPLQMSSDKIESYEGKTGLEFITRCPTSWEKTVVPEAEIGKYVTIARKERGGDTWYVGSITASEPRKVSLPLDFIDSDAVYTARIFADGEGADFRSNPYPLDIYEKDVKAGDILELNLAPGGGAAIILSKVK